MMTVALYIKVTNSIVLGGGARLDKLEGYIEEAYKKALLNAHPIGSYYWSNDSTDPSDLFGGEWEQIKDRFVYAAGTYAANTRDGEEAVTLGTAQIPSHAHGLNNHTHAVGTLAVSVGSHSHNFGTGYDGIRYNYTTTGSKGVSEVRVAASSSGSYYVPYVASSAVDYSCLSGVSSTTPTASISGATGGSTVNTNDTGGSGAHNNMPPYIVAYCWRRIA